PTSEELIAKYADNPENLDNGQPNVNMDDVTSADPRDPALPQASEEPRPSSPLPTANPPVLRVQVPPYEPNFGDFRTVKRRFYDTSAFCHQAWAYFLIHCIDEWDELDDDSRYTLTVELLADLRSRGTYKQCRAEDPLLVIFTDCLKRMLEYGEGEYKYTGDTSVDTVCRTQANGVSFAEWILRKEPQYASKVVRDDIVYFWLRLERLVKHSIRFYDDWAAVIPSARSVRRRSSETAREQSVVPPSSLALAAAQQMASVSLALPSSSTSHPVSSVQAASISIPAAVPVAAVVLPSAAVPPALSPPSTFPQPASQPVSVQPTRSSVSLRLSIPPGYTPAKPPSADPQPQSSRPITFRRINSEPAYVKEERAFIVEPAEQQPIRQHTFEQELHMLDARHGRVIILNITNDHPHGDLGISVFYIRADEYLDCALHDRPHQDIILTEAFPYMEDLRYA
ncbi:hypothetical protein KFL_009100020, partial [Klebsormidium nitens]